MITAARMTLLAMMLGLSATTSFGEDALVALDARGGFQDPAYDLLRGPVAERLDASSAEDDHPLLPVLRFAYSHFERMQSEIVDYRCTLVKRERVRSRLQSAEHMRMKLRHRRTENSRVVAPFSVYLKYLAPTKIEGREVLYVEGRDNGHLVGTKGGTSATRKITMAVDPLGPWGMDGNRYPITEVGVLNLTRRLIEEGTHYMRIDEARECQVTDIGGAEINHRSCRYIRVTFPVKRRQLRFHMAEIFIDDELNIPVRFAAYDWPTGEDESPQLLEEYTYLDMQLNVGLTEADFQRTNPRYEFSQPKRQ